MLINRSGRLRSQAGKTTEATKATVTESKSADAMATAATLIKNVNNYRLRQKFMLYPMHLY